MFVTLLTAAIVIYAIYWWLNSKPKHYPPGPPVLPIVGSLPFLPKEYMHLTLDEWKDKYGPVVGAVLPPNFHMIYVSGFNAVQEVLHRDEFQGRPDNEFIRQRSFNKVLGLIFTEGQYWVEQRRFTLRHLRDLGFGKSSMDSIVHDEVDEVFEILKNKRELQVCGFFNRFFLNILWAIVAGHRFSRDDKTFKSLQQLLNQLSKSTSSRGSLAILFPILKYLAPKQSGHTITMTAITAMQDLLKNTIKEHRKSFDPDNPRDFIDVYIKEIEDQKKYPETTFTDESLIIVGLDLFFAGTESVSNTLAFTILYMVLYPEVQKAVHKELDEVVGRSRKPCLADRPQLPYVEAVLEEVSRINTVAPIAVPHRAMKDTTLLGYHIPKDSLVFPNLWSIMHDKKHWGDPKAFRPERFINQEGKFVKDEYFVLFGAGKRICIGERLAVNSLFTFFTTLMQSYSISLPPNAPKPSTKAAHGFTTTPEPFSVIFTERN